VQHSFQSNNACFPIDGSAGYWNDLELRRFDISKYKKRCLGLHKQDYEVKICTPVHRTFELWPLYLSILDVLGSSSFFIIILTGVRLSLLDTAAITLLLYQPHMMDYGVCGATGELRLARETEVLWENLAQGHFDWRGPAAIVNDRPSSLQRRCSTSTNLQLSDRKNMVSGPRWGLTPRQIWRTDHRS
jgi:hypothetical protein